MTDSRELKKHSPTLNRLLKSRLAPSRETTLLEVAVKEERPVKPAAGDCCGSSCNPCVMDLFREELKVWKECGEYRKHINDDGGEKSAALLPDRQPATTLESEPVRKIPGAFDW